MRSLLVPRSALALLGTLGTRTSRNSERVPLPKDGLNLDTVGSNLQLP